MLRPQVPGRAVRPAWSSVQAHGTGIEVRTGLLEEEARSLIQGFAKWIKTRTPFVTVKIASSGLPSDGAGCPSSLCFGACDTLFPSEILC